MARPQLRHLGIHVRDLAAMEAFYTRVLDLVATDRGAGQTFKNDLVSGRAGESPSTVNQISFRVATLDELKAMNDRLRNAGIGSVRPVNHGNALSLYFPDPEGNFVEVYLDTPWHVPQPHGDPLDLALPNQEILAATEARCRADPGFMLRAEREAELARRLQRSA